TPTDRFTATLAYSYTRVSDSTSNIFSPLENVNPNPYLIRPGGATRPQQANVTAYDFEPINDARQHEGGLTLELDTDLGKLKSITGYAQVDSRNRLDFDGTYVPNTIINSAQRERTFQQALDFTTTKFDIVDLIVGATYFHDRLFFPEPTNLYVGNASNVATNPGTTPGNLATDYTIAQSGYFDQKKTAWAAYFDATVRATDKLSINAGGRYSEERQTVAGYQTSPFPASVRNPASAKAKFSRFTPRVSIRYEVGQRSNVYVSYSQGFRSGAFIGNLPSCVNLIPVADNCYAPARQETIEAWEAGFKTAGRGFRFEFAGFHYDYKGLQVSATRALVVNGATFPVVEVGNAPSAKIYGADGSAEWKPVENLTLRASATWLHARYGKNFLFSGTGVAATGPGGGVGINLNADPLKSLLNVSQVQDLSGLQMSRAPNFNASAGVEYLIPQGEGGIRLSLNGKYTSRYVVTNPSIWCQPTAANGNCDGIPADRQREQRFTEGAFVMLNASVTWTDPTDRYLVRLWGTNLTDHRYRLHYTGTGTGTYAPAAAPAVYGITVGAKM
ncbi:MAG: TonB-dependent receptor, partial [Hyphomicrobiales bacterium]